MTAHPIDTEALAKRAGHILFTEGPEQPAATARETCILLDLLAAADRRATRAEAQSEARRINADYWRARVKAVEDICDLPAEDAEDMDAISAHYASGYEIALQDIRRALEG